MDKYSKAIMDRDLCLKIMKEISIEREQIFNQIVSMDMSEFKGNYECIKKRISLCDECFNIHMKKYLDAISYLEKYNSSPIWKKWIMNRIIN